MHNWDYATLPTDETDEGIRFRLERMICYGLNGKKLRYDELEKHLPFLVIPEEKRRVLEYFLATREKSY